MPTFDAQQALDQMEGDKEALVMLLPTFRRVFPQRIDELVAAIDRSDASNLAAVAHSFKSSLGLFAAGRASELTRRLEIHAREADFDGARRTLAELKTECLRLEADLSAFLEPTE